MQVEMHHAKGNRQHIEKIWREEVWKAAANVSINDVFARWCVFAFYSLGHFWNLEHLSFELWHLSFGPVKAERKNKWRIAVIMSEICPSGSVVGRGSGNWVQYEVSLTAIDMEEHTGRGCNSIIVPLVSHFKWGNLSWYFWKKAPSQ